MRKASQQLINGKTVVVFESGKVDFSPVRSVTPGAAPNYFPPTAVQPGSVGDKDYSPLAKIGDFIYNAPMERSTSTRPPSTSIAVARPTTASCTTRSFRSARATAS